uniref:Uncharacterized protein n=1 Tax=Magallana gigas TaxID=29159 RepID=K1PH61_MAGGI
MSKMKDLLPKSQVNAQLSGQLQFAVKSGTCPTDICVSVFDNGCSSDLTCPGDFKCCSNNCGKNMCYPPKAQAAQQEQPLHVSFVQNGGMEFNNHCYYNSKWYSAGQNLISRNGDVCTCVNRDKITCSRSNINNVNNNNQQSNNFNGNRNNFNTQYNNNANNGQRFQQNSPVQQQANFRMGPDTWQSSWTTKAPPTTTTQREATPHPAKIFIQNINHNQVMNGLGSNQQANGQMYNSLGDHKMTQTPAFFHASPVKEAQANGVINGHVNFHDPFEPASTHAHQSLFDKGFPSIANKPLYVQEHKTESSGPYKPIMDGNVNFGLPSKQAGNVWAGPLTTEISVMQEVGSPGGSHQGQSVAQEYNPWGVTQTYENTGFSQNVVQNIELGLLESQTQGFVASSDFNAAFFGGQEQPQDISNPSNQNNRQVQSQSLEEANQHNNKNKADKFSIIPNPNENLSQGSQFTFGNGRSQAKVRNVISFEALQSQSDLRRFNSKLARTQFSLSDAQGGQPTQIETPIPPTTKIVEKTTAKPIETTETPKTKTKSDIDIQPAVDEIVIETTIPPKTSTQSFIQFLQFVLEQRELVKSKADAKAPETIDNSDFEKSKTAAPTTKIPVKAETVAPTTKLPVKSSSSVPITSSQSTSTAAPTTQKPTTVVKSTTTVPTTSTAAAITTTAAKPTTAKITTASPETTSKARTTTVKTTVVTAAPTVASTEAATSAASTTTSSATPAATTAATVITTTAASKINSIEPTTSVDLGKIPSTLRSLLADIDKQTTVRIKFKKSNDATPEISIEYVTPSPKKDEKQSLKQMATSTIPTTTFKYGPNNAAQKLSFKNPIPIESKESRIKIVTETPPPKVVTSTENPGSTQAGVPNEKSGGLTNSHFSHYQFTDSSPVRMDVVDYSKDIPLNAKQTTTAVPAETPGVYNGNSNNFGTGNIAKQNSPPKTSNGQQEEEALPANATFFQKIMFLKRQKAARENPVEALKKFGDPSANMLNLIKLLPKNNNSPMATTNEAALFTSKVEPPVRKTTSRDTATTPTPKKSPKVVNRNVPAKTNTRVNTPNRNVPAKTNTRVNTPPGNKRTNSRTNSRNTAQRRGSKNAPVTPKGRRPQSNKKKPQPKRNKNQCMYFGKVYRAGQRFKNDKGQKCKCQRGGRVKCKR